MVSEALNHWTYNVSIYAYSVVLSENIVVLSIRKCCLTNRHFMKHDQFSDWEWKLSNGENRLKINFLFSNFQAFLFKINLKKEMLQQSKNKIKAIFSILTRLNRFIIWRKSILPLGLENSLSTYDARKEGVSYKVYWITTVNLCYTIHKFRPHIMVATSVYCALHARTIANKSNWYCRILSHLISNRNHS